MSTILAPDHSFFEPNSQDFTETARYLGYRRSVTPDKAASELIQKACRELFEILVPQAVYEMFDLEVLESETKETAVIQFADVKIISKDLYRNMKGCNKLYLLAATIGPQVDKLIKKEQILNPTYSAVLQSAGAMFAEKLVDYVNEKIKKDALFNHRECKPRYSPGYGDVPLQVQKEFFRLLPCTRIGLTLMDTLIMAPEKSVTAFIAAE